MVLEERWTGASPPLRGSKYGMDRVLLAGGGFAMRDLTYR